MRIAFIGGGNMAAALITGMLRQGFSAARLHVVEIAETTRNAIERNFGVPTFVDLKQGIAASECIILAVKPQNLRDVAVELAGELGQQLIISIAAGVRTCDLSYWLGGYDRIIRVMPNMPAQVMSGISALFAMPAVNTQEKNHAEAILSAVGSTFWVDREDKMDAVTAVSGSGPGYVFYFIEALQQAAEELGFSKDRARRLSVETFLGSAKLANQSLEDVAILRSRVASKGGTTECAISSLDSNHVKQHIVEAVHAAEKRSKTLGEQLGERE